jgi:hypothetical protein
MTADESKSSITAKLVKVFPKRGATFGTFAVQIKVTVASMTKDGQSIIMDPPGSMKADMTVDLAIDGSTTERTEIGTYTYSMNSEVKETIGDTEKRHVMHLNGKASDELSASVDDPKARVHPEATFARDPEKWAEFKPKDGAFSVQLPGNPKESTSKQKGFAETSWVAKAHTGVVHYEVSRIEFDNPAGVDPPAVLKRVLAAYGARDAKEVKVNGVPWVEFKSEEEFRGLTMVSTRRILVTRERSFELAITGVKGQPTEAEKFFKSFQILAKPKDD